MGRAKPTDWVLAACVVVATWGYVRWQHELARNARASRELFEEHRRLVVEASLAQRLEGP